MVKFTSPLEFYDWYDANREELLAFKEAHDSSVGLSSYVYTPTNPTIPIPPGGPWRSKHRYWSHFVKEYPLNKREDVFEEDEIYIVQIFLVLLNENRSGGLFTFLHLYIK